MASLNISTPFRKEPGVSALPPSFNAWRIRKKCSNPTLRPDGKLFTFVAMEHPPRMGRCQADSRSAEAERRWPVSAVSLLTLWAMQPCCGPHCIGTTRPDHSASSVVDSRLSHGKRQQAAVTHRPSCRVPFPGGRAFPLPGWAWGSGSRKSDPRSCGG